MKSKKTAAVSFRKRNLLPPLVVLFFLGRAAEAQQEIVRPETPPVESTSQGIMTNEFQVFALPQPPPPTMPYEPFRIGDFIFRPHADYQFTEAHGILAAPGDQENTTIQQISAGILLNIGPHWALDYTATSADYSNDHFKHELDNAVTLTGQTVYTDWIFGFLQNAVLTSSPLIETGGQTDEQNYLTAATAEHETGEKSSMDLGVYQNIRFASGSGFENTRDWSTLDWLNYTPQPRFEFSIGAGLGYDNADFGPDATYEQAQARLNWRATDKISFQASGGVEEREFLGGNGAGNLFSPIYGGSVQYQPFSATEIYFGVNRSVSQSSFVGEVTTTTSFNGGVSQRLLGQFYLSLGGGYTTAKFSASANDVLANRKDNYYDAVVRLSHSFLGRGSASVFYEYSDNKSTADGFTYISNQFGVEASYSF